MSQKTVTLSSREELDVYMSPVRQELMRILRLAGEALTAKALGDTLRISASSARHHVKKLQDLGLVEVDHCAVINTTYFRLTEADVEIHIGLGQDDGLQDERERWLILLSAFWRSTTRLLSNGRSTGKLWLWPTARRRRGETVPPRRHVP